MRRARLPERGAAALVTTALAGLLVTLALLCGVLGGLLADHRRVAAAADLAALAGAAAAQRHQPGCAAAREVAALNGARLRGCSERSEQVRVEAEILAPLPGGAAAPLRARAEAGPVAGP